MRNFINKTTAQKNVASAARLLVLLHARYPYT